MPKNLRVSLPVFVSPASAGKTHVSPGLLLSLVCCKKRVNIWLYLPHAFMGSKVIYQGQRSSEVKVVRYAENVKIASFEKLKSDLNQTWFIDIICEPSYVHEFTGHVLRSKVI